ncbi:MAG: biliverdin-producing heme oxygenase [Betaproteobacteria bacterium]
MKTSRPNSLHSLLWKATRHGHARVGRHALLAPLMKHDLSIIQYGNALAALHGIYARLETNIVSSLEQHEILFDYQSRLKLPALEHDLAVLERVAFPCETKFCTPKNIGELIAVLYIVEGATQGGKVITQILRQNFRDHLPMHFFSSYGELSMQKWSDFMFFAETTCPESEYNTAANTASALFDSIKIHLDACLKQLKMNYEYRSASTS